MLTPESREAADLIAYLHRSRDELDRMQQQMAAERHALEEERKKLRTRMGGAAAKTHQGTGRTIRGMQKRFDENVARVMEAVKERELRAQLEKSARRKIARCARRSARRAERRGGADHFGVASGPWARRRRRRKPLRAEQLQPGARMRVRGFSKPVVLRRLDGSSAEIEAGPLRMKVALDEIIGVRKRGARHNRRRQRRQAKYYRARAA